MTLQELKNELVYPSTRVWHADAAKKDFDFYTKSMSAATAEKAVAAWNRGCQVWRTGIQSLNFFSVDGEKVERLNP